MAIAAVPDPGRRAPARRVHRLRRPGRRRGHARDRRAAGHRGDAAAGARLDRARGDRGGPRADRRPRGRQLGQLRGRRRARLADRQADAADPRARRGGGRADHRRARPGPHRAVEGRGRRAADPRPDGQLGDAASEDIIVDCLTFPIATGQEETRRDAIETIEAIAELKRRHPDVQTTLGVSNVSFGLKPAARAVLNSVFLAECVQAGLDSAIVHPSKIMPLARIPEEQREVALDLVYDRRRPGYDPLARMLELFEGVDATSAKAERAAELAALPLEERLKRRIIDGERNGLEADLDLALAERPALEIVNEILLDGMKTVGELFGSGQMQLPFVLQSAEVMKASVGYLEPHMEKSDGGRPGQDRARDGPGRRARHRQEPGRHHLVQQRLRRGEHRHQAADLRDHRRRRGAQGRRHRHVRAAREVHRGDAGQPGRAERPRPGRPLAGAARRRGAHPRLRRAGPGRAVPAARSATPATPSRACA